MDALLSELDAGSVVSRRFISHRSAAAAAVLSEHSAVLESPGHSQWERPDPLLEPRRGFPFNV